MYTQLDDMPLLAISRCHLVLKLVGAHHLKS
jgi:hypothetical protein